MKHHSYRLSTGIILLLLAGCRSSIDPVSDGYVGDYSRIENGTVQAHRVSAIVSRNNKQGTDFTLVLAEAESQRELGTARVKKSKGRWKLSSPLLAGKSEIELESHGACAEEVPTEPGGPSLTIVCVQTSTISLFSTDPSGKYRVLLYLSEKGQERPDLESPEGRVTLQDVFERVLTSSYETRIGAEKLYQAHEEVKLVRSRLFPSLGLSSAVMLVSYPMTAVAMVGSLMPFLFPSRWFDLDRQKSLYEGEVLGYRQLIATQMNLAEDIYRSIQRDQEVLERLRHVLASTQARRELIVVRTQLGYAPPSDLTELDDLIYREQNEVSELEQGLVSQYAILSRGLGLSPRAGIRSLAPVEPLPKEELVPVVAEDLMAEALAGSVELKQALFLERAAAFQKSSVTYSVLNASDWISLNEGVIHQVRIAKSALRELRLLREASEDKLQEQVISLSARHNQILERNTRVQGAVEARRRSLELIQQQYDNGTASVLQVKSAFENLLRGEIEQVDARSAMAVIKGKLRRLLWKESYALPLTMQIPGR